MWLKEKHMGAIASLCLLSVSNLAAAADCKVAPPRSPMSTYSFSADGKTTYVVTPEGQHTPSHPYSDADGGSNLLPTEYKEVCDSLGKTIPNTLPSTPEHPYNLHPDPLISSIDKTSPTDDITAALKKIRGGLNIHGQLDKASVKLMIDILEGNPVPDRVYSGFALLHYTGPNRIKKVRPICTGNTECARNLDGTLAVPSSVIGGNVDIHQIWFDNHIESDTALLDPSEVLGVPWTITYAVDVLSKGREDFAPMVMYFDDPAISPPGMPPMPLTNMDQTFFPMEEGTRTVYKMAMAPGKYWNLTYHWGWRQHPPRVQVTENTRKKMGGKSLTEWETLAFGVNPRQDETTKLAAINMIGDLAPAKRMWNALRKLDGHRDAEALLAEVERAFDQWKDRTNLPDGVTQDPNADITLFYANNTIYGHMRNMPAGARNQPSFPEWQTRGTHLKVHLVNGDYFDHGYVNVDFGGSRGWENMFQPTQAVGGGGQWFTFGRNYWGMNAGAPFAMNQQGQMIPGAIAIPIASRPSNGANALNADRSLAPGVVLGVHDVDILFNFDPSRRLRFYQFDPFHHEVAVWSVH
ncbi:MAG: hypothetical protein V4582_00490 [Pseudomonadota bacterium]